MNERLRGHFGEVSGRLDGLTGALRDVCDGILERGVPTSEEVSGYKERLERGRREMMLLSGYAMGLMVGSGFLEPDMGIFDKLMDGQELGVRLSGLFGEKVERVARRGHSH